MKAEKKKEIPRKSRSARTTRRLSPVGAWLREAVREVRRDMAEVAAGRPGSLRAYTADELLRELHS